MTLEQILKGIESAESKLASREAIDNPTIISTHMYRLGQYTSALEKYLGDCEAEYEVTWAKIYNGYLNPMLVVTNDPETVNEVKLSRKPLSATAAKQQADVDTAADKGNIKRLTRYVSSSWRNQTGAMARINHIQQESKTGGP